MLGADKNKEICCKTMYDAMLEGYALLDIVRNVQGEPYDYRFVEVNRQFENITGISRNEILGRMVRQKLTIIDECWYEIYKSLAETGKVIQFEHFFESIDRYFRVSAFRPCSDQIITLFTDITLQKKAEETLQIHKILFENAQDIVLYVKMDGQIADANTCACEKYGYTKQQLISKQIQDIRHPTAASEYEHQMHEADTTGIVFESMHVRSNGTSFPVEVSAKSTNTDKGRIRIHIIRDITRRKEQEEKITWFAKYDALTGIANRASFIMQLEQEIQRSLRTGTPIAVMLFDVDKFKYINDHYGHEAGDAVLRHVAVKVQEVLRTTDQIGRYGGDEFVIMLTEVEDCNGIVSLADRIQAAAGETVTYRDMKLNVKISIGISLYPEDADSPDSLLHCADKAMYLAKQMGGGGYSFFRCCTPPCTSDRLCLDRSSEHTNNGLI